MKFYRRLTPFKAISFDLDDTLYSNHEIMHAIEQKMIIYFAKELSEYKVTFNRHYWFQFRQQILLIKPDFKHDVVALRYESYLFGLVALKIKHEKAKVVAQQALDYFISLRSDFIVPKASHDLLSNLSKKIPLIAISNGNVDTEALGIAQYFQFIYHAGYQVNSNNHLLRQKPESDMFTLACQQLNILPCQLLHVGDCGNADINGALNAGCQAVWLSCYSVGKPLTVLPHIELNKLSQLEQLLCC